MAQFRNLHSPRGFTLLEVLVALSLSLLLISAIYAGVRLYYRYSTSGHEDVERTLLARALLRRIKLDVRSVMYRAATPATTSSSTSTSSSGSSSSGSGSSGSSSGSSSSGGSGSSGSGSGASGGSGSSSSSGGGSSGSSSSSSSSSTSTTPDDAYNTSNTGLYGNMTTLLMHVSKPGNEQKAAMLAATGNTQIRTSDLSTVAYFVSGGTATGNLQQAISRPGLARLEGDRLALAMADQQSSVALMATMTEILAPEVDAIKFTYFDGFHWRYDWDSNILGGMPKAIEVLVELRPAPGRSSAPNVYRLLIAIPLAKPIDTSLVTTP